MSDHASHPFTRRHFLKAATTSSVAAAAVAAPMIVPRYVLGAGAVPPSEKVVLGAIGVGGRGSYVLSCFLQEADVHAVAVTEVKKVRRENARNAVNKANGNDQCKVYGDLREMLDRKDIDACMIATGPNWHAAAASLTARAGKDMYCEKPCTKNINESLVLSDIIKRTGRVFQAGTQRRSLPNFLYAIELARKGKLGKLERVHAQPLGLKTESSGWRAPEPAPDKEDVDWDMFLGPAAYRPYNRKDLDGFNFEKGGGLTGGGVLEWGSHCVDLCQWANDADYQAPVTYEPVGNRLEATYANGVKLVLRDDGWLPLGSCPVRFEGAEGWVETADGGDVMAEPASLLAGRRQKITGYPANFHVRNFLDCVKTRALPRAHVDAMCWSHITCHAANIALFLKRKVTYDAKRHEFVNDDEANRLRAEAMREPWRL